MRELTNGSENWNAEPHCLYLIKDFNISKTSNKISKPHVDHEDRLYDFEDVYSMDQDFHVYAVIRKCKVVQVCVSMSRKVPTNSEDSQT